MTVKEAMRFYPASAFLFGREAVEDVELGGVHLRRGAWVFISPYVVQHDPKYYADPERFDPERFSPGRLQEIPPYAYLPFGGGPRICIGNAFAVMEMVLVAATILQKYHVQPGPAAAGRRNGSRDAAPRRPADEGDLAVRRRRRPPPDRACSFPTGPADGGDGRRLGRQLAGQRFLRDRVDRRHEVERHAGNLHVLRAVQRVAVQQPARRRHQAAVPNIDDPRGVLRRDDALLKIQQPPR